MHACLVTRASNVCYNAITELPLGIFDKLVLIETLFAEGNTITVLPPLIFAKLTKLKSLYVLPQNHS